MGYFFGVLSLLQTLAFLIAGIYLILHNHDEAGGWCIFFSVLTVASFSYKQGK